MYSLKDSRYRFLQCLKHLSRRHSNSSRKTSNQVTSSYIQSHLFFSRICTSNLDLKHLSCLLTNKDIMLSSYMLYDCFVKLISSNLQRKKRGIKLTTIIRV